MFYLEWFDKTSDDFIGRLLLPGVTEDEYRKIFGLDPDDPPLDFIISNEHKEWLNQKTKDVQFDFNIYDYFIGPYSS